MFVSTNHQKTFIFFSSQPLILRYRYLPHFTKVNAHIIGMYNGNFHQILKLTKKVNVVTNGHVIKVILLGYLKTPYRLDVARSFLLPLLEMDTMVRLRIILSSGFSRACNFQCALDCGAVSVKRIKSIQCDLIIIILLVTILHLLCFGTCLFIGDLCAESIFLICKF